MTGGHDLGGHDLDVLSALLDGELSGDEQRRTVAHLEQCPRCQAELESIRITRRIVRSLPEVDPPAAFYERLARTGRRRRAGLVAVGATAAVSAVLLAVASPRDPGVAPEVPRMVDAHVSAASANGDLFSNLVPGAVPVTFGR